MPDRQAHAGRLLPHRFDLAQGLDQSSKHC
jgi:hypothetical protein